MSGDISIDLLRTLLRYEPETGKLFWLERDASLFEATEARTPEWLCKWWNNRFAGQEALTRAETWGHRTGKILSQQVKAHRVIWAMVYGSWPKGCIDHIDGDAGNNRIENLRDVTHAVNMQNKRLYKSNQSGAHGVTWYKPRQEWVAHVRVNGKRKHIGYFKEVGAAIAARRKVEAGLFHVNHGRAA